MLKYRIHIAVRFFETDCQVATVVMETVQLVLRQFENDTVN